MNYIKHLSGFFNRIIQDERLNPTHISLYMSLFQFWNVQRFRNPISISREEVMKVSKICSKATYHKCMRELHNYGYLHYDPSYNPFRGSLITLFDFDEIDKDKTKKRKGSRTTAEQVVNKLCTSTEQALVPSINSINKLNDINSSNEKEKTDQKLKTTLTPKNNQIENEKENEKDTAQAVKNFTEKKLLEKRKENINPENRNEMSGNNTSENLSSGFQRPVYGQIKKYFEEKKWPEIESLKFFNHYESNGWLVGKTQMKNWQAAANKWMINSTNFKTNDQSHIRPGKLTAPNDKNYSEPL